MVKRKKATAAVSPKTSKNQVGPTLLEPKGYVAVGGGPVMLGRKSAGKEGYVLLTPGGQHQPVAKKGKKK